ncbi:MAG: hypothetical protein HWQ39_00970, partial [Nostoc sp. NMS8]|nr:hypothetical protein [Nostoc sp. NMS8]
TISLHYRSLWFNYLKIAVIRQVVNLRIKGNSKFWLKGNAEIMLHLRCQWIARSWDNFCGSIFDSFIKPQTA